MSLLKRLLGKLGKSLADEADLPDDTLVEQELANARQEMLIESLQQQGLLAADDVSVNAARALAAHNPDALQTLLRSPRNLPVAAQTIQPQHIADPTEAAIQARMKATNEPYHVAATAVGDAIN